MRLTHLLPALMLSLPLMAASQEGVDLLGEGPATGAAPAVDAAAPEGEASPEDRLKRARAQGQMQAGVDALRRFNEDKVRNANAIVDAAVAFQQAHALYTELKDQDALAEVQASLFWCRKQMDHDAIKTYLASKGAVATKVTETMEQVASIQVAPEESKGYFARAEKFAKAHPDDHLQTAIMFLEVAERFPGQPEGVQASRKALDAQQKLMKAMSDANSAARQTRFTRANGVKAGDTAIPAPDQVKAGIELLKKNYAKAYLKKEQGDKRRLARRLFEEAARNKGDSAVYYAVLTETARLAQEGEDYECLLDAIDTLGGAFTGYDVAAEKASWLKKAGATKPVPAAIVKLIDNPTDAQANLTVGKYFCFDLRRWAEGLPMLSLGSDAALAKIAEMESAKPQTGEEQMQVADAWYDAAKKSTAAVDKTGAFARAMSWYGMAQPTLAGLAKDKATTRMAEIDKLLPLDMDKVDWVVLTASQWEKLKGKTIALPAKTARLDTGIDLKAGERVRLVAHPTEEYTLDVGWYGKFTANWKGRRYRSGNGDNTVYYSSWGEFPVGAVVGWLGANGQKKNCGVVEGPGRLYLAPYSPESTVGGTGAIRVKLLPVED